MPTGIPLLKCRLVFSTTSKPPVVHYPHSLINNLASEVEKASDVIKQLKQDSENISTVVNVISDIAEQTNLFVCRFY
jgi:hypothetical protein